MKIGVSGASGQLGKAVVAELLGRGPEHEIVAITRTPEAVTGRIEGRLGDYDRPDTLADAYRGVERLLIIPSHDVRPGVRDRHFVTAIDAAVKVGVRHVVMISSAAARETPMSAMYAPYHMGEQHLMRTAARWTILRMNYYAETFAQMVPMALQSGILPGLAENRVAFVSRDDLGAAAAGILIGDGHAGVIYNATGPAALAGAQRAALVFETTGKPLRFMALDEAALRAGLTQPAIDEQYINALVDIEKSFVQGCFDIVTGDVERLAGRAPRALQDVLRASLAQV